MSPGSCPVRDSGRPCLDYRLVTLFSENRPLSAIACASFASAPSTRGGIKCTSTSRPTSCFGDRERQAAVKRWSLRPAASVWSGAHILALNVGQPVFEVRELVVDCFLAGLNEQPYLSRSASRVEAEIAMADYLFCSPTACFATWKAASTLSFATGSRMPVDEDCTALGCSGSPIQVETSR
jgi:hypothetical protein